MQDAAGFYLYSSGKRCSFFYTSVWDRQTETHTGCYGPVFVLYLYYTYDICKGMSGTAGSYRVICRQFYHDAGSSLFIGIYTVSCMQSDPRQSGGDEKMEEDRCLENSNRQIKRTKWNLKQI